MINSGRFFLRTQEVDFDTITRGATWFMYASTPKLQELLSRPEPRRLAPVAVLFHMRLTRPIGGALLVLLGLAVILRDQNRHVFISAGLCLAVCAVVLHVDPRVQVPRRQRLRLAAAGGVAAGAAVRPRRAGRTSTRCTRKECGMVLRSPT